MRVFVAGVSSEQQYVKSIISFYAMMVRDGDLRTAKAGSPGVHARKEIGSIFEAEKEYDALLMLDLDMSVPRDMLEKMRAHDLDMVAAHYYRRRADPMISVVQVQREGLPYPYVPLIDVPREGLHEIASTGLGSVLIKREVYEAVQDSLAEGEHPFNMGPLEWLTGDQGHFGQDVRFFALARRLGYNLYLDASLECEHAHTSWLNHELYDSRGDRNKQAGNWGELFKVSKEKNGMNRHTAQIRLEQLQMVLDRLVGDLDKAKTVVEQLDKQIGVVTGQIEERRIDIEELDTPPGAERVPLPVVGNPEDLKKE